MAQWPTTIRIGSQHLKVLVTSSQGDGLMKGRLPVQPPHPRALVTLLEGVALYSGEPLYVVISAGNHRDAWLGSEQWCEDLWPAESPLVRFDFAIPPPRRRRTLRGVGDFRDVRRQLRLVAERAVLSEAYGAIRFARPNRESTASASSMARTSANGLCVRSSSSRASAPFTRGSSRIALTSWPASSMLVDEPLATAARSSSACWPRPNAPLVSWSRPWSPAWSRCRSVPPGATFLVPEVPFSAGFRSVQPPAATAGEFETRRTRKGSRGSNPFSSAGIAADSQVPMCRHHRRRRRAPARAPRAALCWRCSPRSTGGNGHCQFIGSDESECQSELYRRRGAPSFRSPDDEQRRGVMISVDDLAALGRVPVSIPTTIDGANRAMASRRSPLMPSRLLLGPVPLGDRQVMPQLFGGTTWAVARGVALNPPPLAEGARIDRVEAELIE